MTAARRFTLLGIALAVILALVSAASPAPLPSDGDAFERIGRQPIEPGCAVLNCFRVVVPWVIVHLPGPALVRWRTYAVVFDTAAAIAVGALALMLGVPIRAATYTVALSGLGVGTLATIYHPYTADPLIFLLAPIIVMQLLSDRIGRAGLLAAFGIFAKEFAAAPLWIFVFYSWLDRRSATFTRVLTAAVMVTCAWAALHAFFIARYHYTHGQLPFRALVAGGYARIWLDELGPKSAGAALFGMYGALYLLIPFGWRLCGRQIRLLAAASLPAVLAFAYVETPERALWNFHFLAVPLAARALDELPPPAAWLFVSAYGMASLKLGAQLVFVPAARFGLGVSMALAVAAIVYAWRNSRKAPSSADWPATSTNSA